MNSLLRLLWALPLVLAIGAGAMLVLRRLVLPSAHGRRAAQRLVCREQLALSDHGRLHLIEVDGHAYLLVESAQQVVLQSLTAPSRALASVPERSRPAWLRHLTGAAR